jgi:hypothetical protein
MKRTLVVLSCALFGTILVGDSACGGGFGDIPSAEQLSVTIESGLLGATTRIPISFSTPNPYTVKIEAIKDGKVDTTFNGYVRLSSQPGTVQSVSGPNTNGRNVQLVNGVADGVQLELLAAYGDTRIQAEDLGYVPADPARNPPPQCSNGKDDNGNGLIDFPADPGCAFANDDTENGGTYSAGVTTAIHYYVPRIADVNGGPEGGTAGTPFPNEQVNVDTGYRGAGTYAFDVIVTRVASSGFYVTDTTEDAPGGGGFASVFAYNFDAPPNMRQCDRLRTFGGTSSDFHGFTEMNYPTWELEEWDPATRLCGIPDPHMLATDCTGVAKNAVSLGISDCSSITGGTSTLLNVAAALVRIQTFPPVVDTTKSPPVLVQAGSAVHIGAHFGSGHPSPTTGYTPTADATNCDLNGDGKVDFTTGTLEDTCALACEADPECSEFTNYATENQFNMVVQALGIPGPNGQPNVTSSIDIQGDGSTDAQFDPTLAKGNPIESFTGTLYYFSGGTQFTIQARCADDIVTDLSASPIPSDTACVHARTILDTSAGAN